MARSRQTIGPPVELVIGADQKMWKMRWPASLGSGRLLNEDFLWPTPLWIRSLGADFLPSTSWASSVVYPQQLASSRRRFSSLPKDDK